MIKTNKKPSAKKTETKKPEFVKVPGCLRDGNPTGAEICQHFDKGECTFDGQCKLKNI